MVPTFRDNVVVYYGMVDMSVSFVLAISTIQDETIFFFFRNVVIHLLAYIELYIRKTLPDLLTYTIAKI